jgi:hypothetical protein
MKIGNSLPGQRFFLVSHGHLVHHLIKSRAKVERNLPDYDAPLRRRRLADLDDARGCARTVLPNQKLIGTVVQPALDR